jgi:hypothetical protein
VKFIAKAFKVLPIDLFCRSFTSLAGFLQVFAVIDGKKGRQWLE